MTDTDRSGSFFYETFFRWTLLDLSLNGHDALAAVCSQIDNLSVEEQHFDTLLLDGLVGGRRKAELRRECTGRRGSEPAFQMFLNG